jgi:N-acetylglutamate synthase-like GNAT family acetyltransferase
MIQAEMKIVIRDAEKADAAMIADLIDELGYKIAPEETRQKISRLSKRTNDRVMVAEYENEVVGVLSLHIMPLLHLEKKLCRITSMVVRRTHRRKYIGQRLLEMAEAYARANDCGRIEITSGIQREDAHAFYVHLGYTEKSKRFVKELEGSTGEREKRQ